MEQSENNFYITLMSNISLNEFDNNVQSAFTNKLSKVCRIPSDNWEVGVTEIYFNSFSKMAAKIQSQFSDNVENIEMNASPGPTAKKKRRRREYVKNQFTSSQTELFNVNNRNYHNLELLEEGKRFKRAVRQLKIIVHDEYDIVLKDSEIKEICYQKNDLNFGKFLEFLTSHIIFNDGVFGPKTSLETVKKLVKDNMINIISTYNWQNLEKRSYERKKNDFILHIYMGSNEASLAVLQLITFAKLEEFLVDIIAQIPKNRRNVEKMIELFDIFYSTYKINNEKLNEENDTILGIQFVEFGVETEINLEKLISTRPEILIEGITLKEIIGIFKTNINFKNVNTLSEKDKISLREKIALSTLDVLKGDPLTSPQIKKQLKKNHIPLNVIYDKKNGNDKIYRAILEPKRYNRMEEFLHDIYNQIPQQDRNKQIFIDTLFAAFDANADKLPEPVQITPPVTVNSEATEIPKTTTFVRIPPHISQPPSIFNYKHLGDNVYEVPVNSDMNDKMQFDEAQQQDPSQAQTVENKSVPAKSEGNAADNIQTIVEAPKPLMFKDLNLVDKNSIHQEPIHKPRINTTPNANFIYVYSDIIKPRFCGSQLVRVLRVIPNTDTAQKRIEFKNVEYYPLELTNFDSISILLADAQGERIKFHTATTPTYLQLHFRKKRINGI